MYVREGLVANRIQTNNKQVNKKKCDFALHMVWLSLVKCRSHVGKQASLFHFSKSVFVWGLCGWQRDKYSAVACHTED